MPDPVDTPESRSHATSAGSVWRRLFRSIPLIVVLLLLASALEILESGEGRENASRDVLTRVTAAIRGPHDAWKVAVVRVDDADYDALFRNTSPLDVSTLQRLLDAVAAGHPRVIGVDFDTSDTLFRALRFPRDVPVVWARGVFPVCRCDPDATSEPCGVTLPITPASLRHQYTYCDDDARHTAESLPLDFRGGVNDGTAGVATLIRDEDGGIRRYRPTFRTTQGEMPTFAATLATAATKRTSIAELSETPETSETSETSPLFTEERFIDFRPIARTASWTASQVLTIAAQNADFDMFRDRIVLLGGSYWAGRDRYFTPLGEMPGVDVHAQIVETLLRGGGEPPVNRIVLLTILTITSCILVLLFSLYPLGLALRRAAVGVLVLALFGSWAVARWSPAFVPYFIVFLGAVALQQVYLTIRETHNDEVKKWLFGTVRARTPGTEHVPHKELGPHVERRAWDLVRRMFGRNG